MKDKSCIVQFLHPGGEHCPDKGKLFSWEPKDHKRKFMISKGSFVKDGMKKEGEIMFWGEWEPESEVVQEFKKSTMLNGPRFLCKPYYHTKSSYAGLPNTDPFVFGERFHYTNCRQFKTIKGVMSPTQLRNLLAGSVILFGSHKNGKFVLDAVLVVDSWLDHDKSNYKAVLNGRVSNCYQYVSLRPLYDRSQPVTCLESNNHAATSCPPVLNSTHSHRLYFGATYEKQVDEMYSFFPCLPYEDSTYGFARPEIEIKDIISNGLNRSFKLHDFKDKSFAKQLWDDVVRQVTEKHGLALGVYAELPKHRGMGKELLSYSGFSSKC